MAKRELPATMRDRYQAFSREDRSGSLDELTAVAGITASMVSGC